jgi:hypothetical protein
MKNNENEIKVTSPTTTLPQDVVNSKFREIVSVKDTGGSNRNSGSHVDKFLLIASRVMSNSGSFSVKDFIRESKGFECFEPAEIVHLFDQYIAILERYSKVAPVPTIYDYDLWVSIS